jgi:hypothetical protein
MPEQNLIIGPLPNQVPTNSDLGGLAYMDPDPYVTTRSINVVAPTATTTILDSFATAQSRTAKYVVQATYSTVVYASEILLTHDGTYVYTTEFARLTNQPTSLLATFDAVIASDVINFRFTNNVGQDVTVTATRIAINS